VELYGETTSVVYHNTEDMDLPWCCRSKDSFRIKSCCKRILNMFAGCDVKGHHFQQKVVEVQPD
jgi:hypothetical protein